MPHGSTKKTKQGKLSATNECKIAYLTIVLYRLHVEITFLVGLNKCIIKINVTMFLFTFIIWLMEN